MDKLDGSGYYDDFEVNRVAEVEMDPKGTLALGSERDGLKWRKR